MDTTFIAPAILRRLTDYATPDELTPDAIDAAFLRACDEAAAESAAEMARLCASVVTDGSPTGLN